MAIIGNPILAGGGGSGSQSGVVDLAVATTMANELVGTGCGELSSYEVSELWEGIFSGNTYLSFASMASLTSVPDYAFYQCSSLSVFQCPQVEHIGTCAFADCYDLGTVEVGGPDIGVSAFNGCANLSAFTFYSESWTGNVGSSAFYGCGYLSPNNFRSAASIGQYAFAASGATYAESANVYWENLSYVGDHAFEYNGAAYEMSFPVVKCIGSYAFANSPLYFVSIGCSVDSLSEAFGECYSLRTAFIAGDIGDMTSAFYNCSLLREVHLGTLSVPSGIDTAFRGCTSLAYIYVDNSAYDAFVSALPDLSSIITT